MTKAKKWLIGFIAFGPFIFMADIVIFGNILKLLGEKSDFLPWIGLLLIGVWLVANYFLYNFIKTKTEEK